MESTSGPSRWHQWELLLAGGDVDPLDIAHLLEEPSEYQLRRLLRAAPGRDELYDRFATWLSAPDPTASDSELLDLARQGHGELRRLSDERELGVELPAGDLPVNDRRGTGTAPEATESSERLLEAAVDSAAELHRQPLVRALWRIAIATNAGRAVALHLCGPLLAPPISLPAHATLARHGYSVWIDDAAIHLGDSAGGRHHIEDQRSLRGDGDVAALWPTDAEIAGHVADERAAMSPTTTAVELAQLAGSGSPFVRPQLAQHPNLDRPLAELLAGDRHPRVRGALAANPATPSSILAQLAGDADAWVRSRAVANPSTPAQDIDDQGQDPQELRALVARPDASPELLARALGHPDSQVRQALAQRSDLSLPIIEQLARDPEVYVRSKIADNPLTPEHVLERLRADEHRLVRRRAER